MLCGVVIVFGLLCDFFYSVPGCFVMCVSMTWCLEMLCRRDGELCHSDI